MLHSIPSDQHGTFTAPMSHAVDACVHCGFCLAACPTYQQLGQEMDTPRGRIVLMKQVLEGQLAWERAQPHIDRCLACLACEPACPSGVPYRELISPFRALAEPHFRRTPGQRLRRWLARQTLPFPNRLRWAARFGQVAKRLSGVVPSALHPMLDLLPDSLPTRVRWASLTPAQGPRRARVALLAGCAQQVLSPDITSATLDVLSRNGVEVVLPPGQGCCGGLAWHTGDLATAQAWARQNLRAFPTDVDAILSNAAGCGSALHEYHLILRGTSHEAEAEKFGRRVRDVSSFLAQLGFTAPPRGWDRPRRIAYHDACHLLNAQGIRDQPRSLLRAIPGVEVCELLDAHLCCGSAGTYNLDQPEIASALGEKKARAALATDAELVATGNIGCLTQLRTHLAKLGSSLPVRHTIQVIRDAYQNGPTA
jgi:glycolate oxidase iron-sulfur subunit